MDINLKDKNALVCGSSQGIGAAVAIELAAIGANITLVARSAANLQKVKALLDTSQGQKHDYFVADFSDSVDLKKKVKVLLSTQNIHVLVNNSGGPAPGPIHQAETGAFIQAFHNHLICNHILTQAVVAGMKADNYGRIINVISTSVKIPLKNLGVSNTTRGAVASWAKSMANELGAWGITVNNVLPGFTSTSRLDQLIAEIAKKSDNTLEQTKVAMRDTVPMNRFGAAKEVAAAVAFLASPAASYINGINLPVDGGRTGAL